MYILSSPPRTLLDLMAAKTVSLTTIDNVVMMEVDEMLNTGFTDSTNAILPMYRKSVTPRYSPPL